MQRMTLRHRAFSLVELVIVISILAILAAIVIPKYSNASQTARASSLAAQLQTLNKALQLYKNQHNGEYPTADQLITNPWHALTRKTDVNGDTAGSDLGPYIQSAPISPFVGSYVVAADTSGGWQYDASTGKVKAVVPQSVFDRAADLKLDAGDLVVRP